MKLLILGVGYSAGFFARAALARGWEVTGTVRTAEKEHIFDGALSDLEQKYAHLFVRVHRNALVARRCVRAVEKVHDPIEGEGWTVRLDGCDERLAVSRRQLAAVRDSLVG